LIILITDNIPNHRGTPEGQESTILTSS